MTAIVTLIPAYKTDYLAPLLAGLRCQNFKDFRVVLSDDSPDGEITRLLRAGIFNELVRDLNMLVVPGPRQGSQKNIQHLIQGWGHTGQFVHVHLDDDVIFPSFYRSHMAANLSGEFGASVSLRWVTSADGFPQQDLPLPELLEGSDSHVVSVNAKKMFASTIPRCENWLGEITNVLLSAEGARRYAISKMNNFSYYGLGDVGVLLDISRHAPVAVIRDHLSGFRSNPQQSSAQIQSFCVKCGHLAWAALALAAWSDSLISRNEVIQSLGTTFRRTASAYGNNPEIKPFLNLIESAISDRSVIGGEFEILWSSFLETYPDSRSWSPAPSGLFASKITLENRAAFV
jgi:hypothetical protein